jgi:hypothetical protein
MLDLFERLGEMLVQFVAEARAARQVPQKPEGPEAPAAPPAKLQRTSRATLSVRSSRSGRRLNAMTKTAEAVQLMFREEGATATEIREKTGLRVSSAWVERQAAMRHSKLEYLDQNHWRLSVSAVRPGPKTAEMEAADLLSRKDGASKAELRRVFGAWPALQRLNHLANRNGCQLEKVSGSSGRLRFVPIRTE